MTINKFRVTINKFRVTINKFRVTIYGLGNSPLNIGIYNKPCITSTMARPLKVEYAGAYYHAINRGDEESAPVQPSSSP